MLYGALATAAWASEPSAPAPEGLQAFSTGEVTAVIVGALAFVLAARTAWRRWQDYRRRQPRPQVPDTTQSPDTTTGPNTQPMQHLLQMMEVRKEMNPLTEAEVYLAFGRDKEAEALMLDAIRNSPMKLGFRIKLAEIYAQRQDAVSFQSAAAKLKLMTEASGPVWIHICELGRRIDPRNPEYQVVQAPTPEAADFVARHLDGHLDEGSHSPAGGLLPAFDDTQPAGLLPPAAPRRDLRRTTAH